MGPGKNIYRFSDDREPSGSAGKPIFGIIQSLDLTDILIVVVRYFGGTLLGVSGLINAYRNAAKEAINQCTIIVKPVLEKYEIIFAYESINEIMAIIKVSNGKILQQDLSEQCSISLEVTRLNADAFLDRIKNNHLLHNKVELKVL
ncbi:MAG: YigZ family protein [Bacteroidetes bacterium]|nr:YigZ family protein [Bacteroidota bacterium]